MVHFNDIKPGALYYVPKAKSWPKTPTADFYYRHYGPPELSAGQQRVVYKPEPMPFSPEPGVILAIEARDHRLKKTMTRYLVSTTSPWFELVLIDGIGRKVTLTAGRDGIFDIEEQS